MSAWCSLLSKNTPLCTCHDAAVRIGRVQDQKKGLVSKLLMKISSRHYGQIFDNYSVFYFVLSFKVRLKKSSSFQSLKKSLLVCKTRYISFQLTHLF